jgi:hypothetical protein
MICGKCNSKDLVDQGISPFAGNYQVHVYYCKRCLRTWGELENVKDEAITKE